MKHLLTAIALGSVPAIGAHAEGDPIKIAISEWTGQHITVPIAGSVLEEMGFKTPSVSE